MKIRVRGREVEVARSDCGQRPCLRVKGSFREGRVVERLCWTRHLHGCPADSLCPGCRTLSVLSPGETCEVCGDVLGEVTRVS